MEAFLAKTPAQLGAILRGYRQRRGLTQQEVAEQLGLPQKAISLAETHPERLPLSRLFQLLGVLRVEVTLRDAAAQADVKAEW